MTLDLSALRQAVGSLDSALTTADPAVLSHRPPAERALMKAGVIQNFEFTYELCWKFMRRWIGANIEPAIAEGVPRRELFRLAGQNGLIMDVERWMEYHEARNLTAHTYNTARAEEVLAVVRKFSEDARRLLAALESRNA